MDRPKSTLNSDSSLLPGFHIMINLLCNILLVNLYRGNTLIHNKYINKDYLSSKFYPRFGIIY